MPPETATFKEPQLWGYIYKLQGIFGNSIITVIWLNFNIFNISLFYALQMKLRGKYIGTYYSNLGLNPEKIIIISS